MGPGWGSQSSLQRSVCVIPLHGSYSPAISEHRRDGSALSLPLTPTSEPHPLTLRRPDLLWLSLAQIQTSSTQALRKLCPKAMR